MSLSSAGARPVRANATPAKAAAPHPKEGGAPPSLGPIGGSGNRGVGSGSCARPPGSPRSYRPRTQRVGQVDWEQNADLGLFCVWAGSGMV